MVKKFLFDLFRGVLDRLGQGKVLFAVGGVLAIAIFVIAFGGPTKNASTRFDFNYFESLPRYTIIAEAQKFVDQRFPPGSDLNAAITEFTDAGAKCGPGEDRMGIYYVCAYNISRLLSPFATMESPLLSPFVTIEWRIILTPDKAEKKTLRISVNRSLARP